PAAPPGRRPRFRCRRPVPPSPRATRPLHAVPSTAFPTALASRENPCGGGGRLRPGGDGGPLPARGGDAEAGGAPAVPPGRPQLGEDPVAEPGVDALADTAKVGQAVYVRRRATKDDDAVSRMLWEGCPNG